MSEDLKFTADELAGLRAFRAAIIEECARVAETFHCAQCGMDAAAAIRALKDKPHE